MGHLEISPSSLVFCPLSVPLAACDKNDPTSGAQGPTIDIYLELQLWYNAGYKSKYPCQYVGYLFVESGESCVLASLPVLYCCRPMVWMCCMDV